MLPARFIPVQLRTVRRIAFADWPHDWFYDAEKGDLLLGPADPVPEYGLLCIDDRGTFIGLNKEQLFDEHVIQWPDLDIGAVRLVKDTLVLD